MKTPYMWGFNNNIFASVWLSTNFSMKNFSWQLFLLKKLCCFRLKTCFWRIPCWHYTNSFLNPGLVWK